MKKIGWVGRAALVLGLLLLAGLGIVSVVVEMEAEYVLESLAEEGAAKALILYHPSRDARFSDDLSLALSEGLEDEGLAVDRATLTRTTPERPQGYALIAVVGNTYYWTPDFPTLRYLRRARLEELPAIGLIGGAGSTRRSERLLDEALREAGAEVIDTRSFWLWRPNDEDRMDEPNREVALELARRFGAEAGRAVLALVNPRP